MKPVRLSSMDVSKVSFPTAYKSATGTHQDPASYDAQNSPSDSSTLLSKEPVDRVEVSERLLPKENLAKPDKLGLVAHWVQDNAAPPPRWGALIIIKQIMIIISLKMINDEED